MPNQKPDPSLLTIAANERIEKPNLANERSCWLFDQRVLLQLAKRF